MNAAEIIEEIARLPEAEKGKVVEFVRHLPNAETLEAIHEPADNLPRYTSMDEVRARSKTSSTMLNVVFKNRFKKDLKNHSNRRIATKTNCLQ